jgi:hypothetical protein
LLNSSSPQYGNVPAININTTGGLGSHGQAMRQSPLTVFGLPTSGDSIGGVPTINNLRNIRVGPPACSIWTPYPINCPAAQALRSGSGGGGGSTGPTPVNLGATAGGGGGGGGRGNVGNAGGNSPTVSGSAGVSQTFNCVPVCPGTTTPITVASPGGQIVISWNPQ